MNVQGISIRPYTLDDVPRLFEAVLESSEALRPWMPWCQAAYAVQDSRVWIESQIQAFAAGTEFAFVIVSERDHFLGGCGLNKIDRLNLRANLGYWVRSSETGRGIASGAVRVLAAWAFENTDFMRLEIVVAIGNVGSLRVAETAGAGREGILRSRLMLQGRAQDATMYSIIRGKSSV